MSGKERLYPKEPKEFLLAQMVDDLLEITLEMCGKDEKKTLRFPKLFYDGYVSCIITSAVTIQKNVIMANEIARGETRKNMQKEAAANCVWMNHLIRVSTNKGWISEKQRDRWQRLVTSVKWSIVNWMKSDEKIHTGSS